MTPPAKETAVSIVFQSWIGSFVSDMIPKWLAGRHLSRERALSALSPRRLTEIKRTMITLVYTPRFPLVDLRNCLLRLVCVLVTGCNKGSGPDPHRVHPLVGADQEIEAIWQEFGVRVYVNYDPASYFPAQWRSAPVSANGLQIDPDAATQMKHLIPHLLAMYPRALLADNLHAIYLLKSMSFYGRRPRRAAGSGRHLHRQPWRRPRIPRFVFTGDHALRVFTYSI